jgi:hypothetical protein
MELLLTPSSGKAHISHKDNKLRVSGQIFKGQTRLTSVHAYADGEVEYSKQDFNNAQK